MVRTGYRGHVLGMRETIKDAEVYRAPGRDGASKQKAARIADAAARRGRPEAGRYEDWTVYELKVRAKDLGMHGYSDKSRAQLLDMLRHH